MFGGGKTIRDGMAQSPSMTAAGGSPDLVITSALILDSVLGVIKGDIGVKDGRIAAIGKAGNPDIMDGVDPALVIGPGTEVIAGEHMIAPQQAWAALSNGITTMLGGGTGPADGTRATTTTPGPWNIARMLEAAATMPVNRGRFAKANASDDAAIAEQIEAGACALKVHED